MKTPSEDSLRGQVEKWLAPEPAAPVRVTAFGRSRFDGARYVCVEARTPAGVRALFFFRHGDGSWRVYPPAANGKNKRPAAARSIEQTEAAIHALIAAPTEAQSVRSSSAVGGLPQFI
ncbi:hypothetical protein [Trinickia terrae]|uniref:hypothetical protein n=1 Tax=Trinickia terrae TaxID=2571161 RepID=UPI0026BC5FAC